jgi:hypothetical protein
VIASAERDAVVNLDLPGSRHSWHVHRVAARGGIQMNLVINGKEVNLKQSNLRIIIGAGALALIAIIMDIVVASGQSTTGPSPSSVDNSAVTDAVTAWNNQANILYAVTQSSYPAGELNAAAVEVTSGANGYEVSLWWPNGYYEQFTNSQTAGSLSYGMGYIPDGDGTLSNMSVFSQNATMDDNGIITLNGS